MPTDLARFSPVQPPLWPSTPQAIKSLDAKSQGDSFVIRRHKTENKETGSRREHTWPLSTLEDSTPWSALQCVTLWGKVLVCPRGWRGILSCNHWTYVLDLLLSYSCWWCVNLISRLAFFGDPSLVVSCIVFLLFFMRLASCSDSVREGKHNKLGSHFWSCMPRTHQHLVHLVFDHGLPSCSD
jgi:hypothetical protein